MIKLILSFVWAIKPSKRSSINSKKYTTILLIVLMNIPTLYSQNYYVSPNATGSGNGTQGNPWTIYQAAANAQAGDIVNISAGVYPLATSISFNNSGNASNPIVFRGERVAGDERFLSSGCTVLRQDNSSSNDAISLNGDYIIMENMVMLQQYPKWLVVLNGDHCTLDSVVTQYPANVGSSSNHTVRILGDYATLRHSYFWQSPRTVIWVRTNGSGQHCTGFLMEYCTVADYSNHYAIQCMPSPGIGGDPTTYFLEAGIIRNNIFINSGYESAIYLRNVHDYKIYNNLFIKGGGYYGVINFEATDQVVNSPVYDAASIFANNTIWDDRPTTGAYNSGTNELILHGFSNMGGWHFENNVVQGHSVTYLYRYMIGRASSGTPLTGAVVNHNLYYLTNETVESNTNVWASTSYNWSSWTNTFDNNSIVNTNPNFINPTTDPNTWDFRLGSEIPGIDLSSWGITTDYEGNTRTNWTMGAFEFNGIDITPPRVTSALLINATTLRVTFSETLVLAGAQNPANYTISNGIGVNSVSFTGNQATLQTTAHTSGNYTVTVSNVTDAAGNVVNPNNNSAQYSFQIDVTPPELIGASIIDSITLRLSFSEALDPNSGQNINNYSISNGISVLGANVSAATVTLSTSEHSTGSYTVTVNNVTDAAGNVISSQNNSQSYDYQSGGGDNLVLLPVGSVVASVTPEPIHTGNKTIDGKGLNEGDPDSRWAGDTMPEWLVYDLGSVNLLTTTKLSFFKWDEGRTYNYSIQASIDNVNWTTIRSNVVSLPQEWSQETLTPINARYIKITFISNNINSWAGLWEAEFWGNNTSDVTPPQVVGAALTNSTKLIINFSESLNSATAQNKSNYLINNGITVSSAVLSGTQVTLTTLAHSTGTYTVTVNNLTDLAGNLVDPQHKSANYINVVDNVSPYFTGLTVTSSTSLTVKFSEKLDPVKAKNKSNYSINKSIAISSVQLLPDSMSIKLNTSFHSKHKDYTLTISNITDKAGNLISPNPKSVIYRRSNSGTTSTIQNPIEGAISNYWDINYLPEKTIDGTGMINPDSRWMSSTTMPDTLCLDMGNIYTMDSLRISFYQWNSDRLYKYSMLSSIDSLIWEPVVSDIWSDSLEWTNIEFDSTKARFVKLILLESNQNQPASIWEIELYGPTGVTGINNETEIPNSYILSQNYPNPFNPSTEIRFSLPSASNVRLTIYNILGELIMTLTEGNYEAGSYEIEFSASGISSGIYYYRIEAGNFAETKKMIVMK